MIASMIRIQIQLDPATREALRRRAFESGTSASAVAREILERALGVRKGTQARPRRTASELFPFIGIIKDDAENVAEDHDHFLHGDEAVDE